MNISKTFTLCILIITLPLTIAFGQQNHAELEKRDDLLNIRITLPSELNLDGASLFQFALLRAKLPSGIVDSNCIKSLSRKTKFPREISLRDFLNQLVRDFPEYRWEISGGVLNLLPKNNISKLLDLPIKEFKAENATPYEALNIVREKPEVKEKIAEVGLDKAVNSLHILQAYIPNGELSRFSFDIKATTFRGILNEIAKKDGQKTWIFVERHCGNKKQFSIYFKGS